MNKDKHFYKWEPTDSFVLTGKDFSFLYNLLDNITATPQFQERLYSAKETMQIVSLHDMIRSKLQEGVKSGMVKEVNEQEHDNAIKKATQEAQANNS